MSELEKPAVIHVNKETLDYLKLQIESDVRKRLILGIGLPIGGGSLLAIALALALWLPEKVRTIVNESKQVETTLQQAVVDHLKGEEGHDLLRIAVANAMSGPEVRRIVHESAAPEVKRHLNENDRTRQIVFEFFNSSPEGATLVRAVVKEQMDSQAGRQQIRDAIDKGLQAAVDSLRDEMQARSGRAILAVGTSAFMRDPVPIGKGSASELDSFIDQNRNGDQPVTLTLTLGGDVHYAPQACVSYARELREALADRFLGILIVDEYRHPLAFVDADTYLGRAGGNEPAFRDENARMIDAINARRVDDTRAAAEAVDRGSTAILSATGSLANALRDPVWDAIKGADDRVAVVDADHRFIGITRREKLIDAVVMKD